MHLHKPAAVDSSAHGGSGFPESQMSLKVAGGLFLFCLESEERAWTVRRLVAPSLPSERWN